MCLELIILDSKPPVLFQHFCYTGMLPFILCPDLISKSSSRRNLGRRNLGRSHKGAVHLDGIITWGRSSRLNLGFSPWRDLCLHSILDRKFFDRGRGVRIGIIWTGLHWLSLGLLNKTCELRVVRVLIIGLTLELRSLCRTHRDWWGRCVELATLCTFQITGLITGLTLTGHTPWVLGRVILHE